MSGTSRQQLLQLMDSQVPMASDDVHLGISVSLADTDEVGAIELPGTRIS
jgi:hypothetical protein